MVYLVSSLWYLCRRMALSQVAMSKFLSGGDMEWLLQIEEGGDTWGDDRGDGSGELIGDAPVTTVVYEPLKYSQSVVSHFVRLTYIIHSKPDIGYAISLN